MTDLEQERAAHAATREERDAAAAEADPWRELAVKNAAEAERVTEELRRAREALRRIHTRCGGEAFKIAAAALTGAPASPRRRRRCALASRRP